MLVAGNTLDEALSAVKRLNDQGLYVTLDHLGENVTSAAEAGCAAEDYLRLLECIDQAGVSASVSLKLTQLGLNLDFDVCLDNMRRIAREAAAWGNFVRIDMEDSPAVDPTVRIFHCLREEGLTNVGLVIQSCLFRSQEDTRALLAAGARIRLVKGAYKEPPEIAYPRKADVDANCDRLSEMLIEVALASGSKPSLNNGKLPPVAAIATHDEARIRFAQAYAAKVGLPRAALELQMLYGIRSDIQRALAEEGYPVRVYVPYGTEWYPYLMRAAGGAPRQPVVLLVQPVSERRKRSVSRTW